MNPAILIWIVIFGLRAMNSGKTPPEGKAPAGQAVEGATVALFFFHLGLVGILLAFVSAGWPQLALYAWLVLAFPSWAVWRVCQPLRWRRLGLALLLLVYGRSQTRAGRRRLFEWSLGGGPETDSPEADLPATMRSRRSPRESRLVPADGWTTCAEVLKAEATGAIEDAERLVSGLLELPARTRMPRTVARIGFGLLAEAALRRGDMESVMRRASLGSGRDCRFYRLLARAQIAGDAPEPLLWIAWALSPRRIRNFRLLRQARSSAAAMAPPTALNSGSPWAAHLQLLERAARGDRYDRHAVLGLAAVWEGHLDAGAEAHLRARALELGVIDAEAACRAVQEQVFADLEALAGQAEGPWPVGEWGGLGGQLLARAEDRLYGELEPWVEPYRQGHKTEVAYPLVEWDRWVSFQAALRRLEEAFGEEAVATAWHGGLRLAAWNWPCRLLALHQERAAWACHAMFEWTAAMAERFGDEEAARVNHENAAVAARQIAT